MFRRLRISHVEFRFPGPEKLGPSRNGRMERNFSVILIFRNFRPTSRGTPKISEWNFGKCLFHSLPNPGFPEFLVEWKAPLVTEGLSCIPSIIPPLRKNVIVHRTTWLVECSVVEPTALVRGEIQKVILYLISLSTGCFCEGNTVESVNYPLVL